MKNTNYFYMFIMMIFSGALSTMNVWADKYDDIRFGINDVYMILLMSGWMLLFMGMMDYNISVCMIGIGMVVINLFCIRTQFLMTESQYKTSMIPHHSMAVHMSKKLLEKPGVSNNTISFCKQIVETQEKELEWLKNV